MQSYNFWLITGIMLTGYLGSLGLVKKGTINLGQQRQFWNMVLLISFLISGVSGMMMAAAIDQKLVMIWYPTMIWIHVELGIVMAMTAIFHAWWHVSYFAMIGKKK